MPYKDEEKQRLSQKEYYLKNKTRYQESTKRKRLRNQQFIADYKSTRSCSSCPENHPACLVFHHTSNDKEGAIADVIYDWGLERLKAEVAKCILLCSNCHAKLHYNLDYTTTGIKELYAQNPNSHGPQE